MEFVVRPSAHRHGVEDEAMIHALRNAILFDQGQGDYELEMAVGPDQTGRLLEVGFITDGAQLIIIHAMPRTKL